MKNLELKKSWQQNVSDFIGMRPTGGEFPVCVWHPGEHE